MPVSFCEITNAVGEQSNMIATDMRRYQPACGDPKRCAVKEDIFALPGKCQQRALYINLNFELGRAPIPER